MSDEDKTLDEMDDVAEPWEDRGRGWIEDETMDSDHPHRVGMDSVEKISGKLGAVEAFGAAEPPEEANVFGDDNIDVRDQWSTSMCVGFGLVGAVWSRLSLLGYNPERLSAMFTYALARMLGRVVKTHPLHDDGSYPYLAVVGGSQFGFLPERLMPFNQRLVNDEPDFPNFSKATQFRLSSFRKIADDGEGRKKNVMRALAAGHPVPLGMNVGPIFGNYRRGLGPIVHGPRESGGHMTFLVGYRENGTIFRGVNSWGKDYGDNGLYEIHESKLMHSTTSNLYDVRITEAKAA